MIKLPRYKRDQFIFISNLKDLTAHPEHQITLNREGYLLSEQFSTTKLEAKAAWVKQRRNLLISDNGNFTRMKLLVKQFEPQGQQLLKQALADIKQQNKLTDKVIKQRQVLIGLIAEHCQQALQAMDLAQVIARQLMIRPHYLIGLEDFTIPVLMMTGLMHPVFAPKVSEIANFQLKTKQLYQQQVQGLFGHQQQLQQSAKFLVLHAYDYDSAHHGAQQVDTNTDGIAISYGGPMRSRRWLTELELAGIKVSFNEKLPEPYLSAAALTLGAVNGLADNLPVHILGVGSPIMIALIGYWLQQSRAVSIDSTAPFKDANVGTLYGSRYGFIKMDMYKVAARCLINNKAYNSKTPYFKRFEHSFPSNWLALRAELGVSNSSNERELVKLLKAEQALVEQFIPFFSRMRSGQDAMIKQLRIDRAGHNYWILRNICVAVRQRRHDAQALEKWMQYQVKRYQAIAHHKWAKAVQHSYLLKQAL